MYHTFSLHFRIHIVGPGVFFSRASQRPSNALCCTITTCNKEVRFAMRRREGINILYVVKNDFENLVLHLGLLESGKTSYNSSSSVASDRPRSGT